MFELVADGAWKGSRIMQMGLFIVRNRQVGRWSSQVVCSDDYPSSRLAFSSISLGRRSRRRRTWCRLPSQSPAPKETAIRSEAPAGHQPTACGVRHARHVRPATRSGGLTHLHQPPAEQVSPFHRQGHNQQTARFSRAAVKWSLAPLIRLAGAEAS